MLAISGGKGGCGKTTATLGLAAAIACAGGRPLVVDADVAVPDLHIRAGVEPDPGLCAIADGHSPERVAQTSRVVPGVDVLPAGSTSTCPPAALDRLGEVARPVLLDCPAGAGPDAATPVRAADACVLVTTTAPESREDAAKTAGMADALGVPIVGTVTRTRDMDAEPGRGDDATAPGSPTRASRRRGFDEEPVVSVPTVEGRPLDDARVRDRFDAIRREISRLSSPHTGKNHHGGRQNDRRTHVVKSTTDNQTAPGSGAGSGGIFNVW